MEDHGDEPEGGRCARCERFVTMAEEVHGVDGDLCEVCAEEGAMETQGAAVEKLQAGMEEALEEAGEDLAFARRVLDLAVGFHDRGFKECARLEHKADVAKEYARKKSRERAPEDARRDIRGQGGPDYY